MDATNTRRIVLFGKSGVGKSSLANTIFREKLFKDSLNSETRQCQVKTKSINKRNITLIETPGISGQDWSENDLKLEKLRCIIECAPGPHAFLIVLKVEKFTEHEKAIITQLCTFFSEDALKYAVVVFTHGDQLAEEVTIQEFVNESEGLNNLVKKCSGRCHVVDNKYWKNNQEDEYRSNEIHVAELLKTIDKIITDNSDAYYTNEMLREVEREIQTEEKHIRCSGNMLQREQAKIKVLKKRLNNSSWMWIGGLAACAALGGLLTVILIKSNAVEHYTIIPEVTSLPEVVVEHIAEEVVSPSVSVIEPVVPEAVTPTATLLNILDLIMDRLMALYEGTYNPFNPFE